MGKQSCIFRTLIFRCSNQVKPLSQLLSANCFHFSLETLSFFLRKKTNHSFILRDVMTLWFKYNNFQNLFLYLLPVAIMFCHIQLKIYVRLFINICRDLLFFHSEIMTLTTWSSGCGSACGRRSSAWCLWPLTPASWFSTSPVSLRRASPVSSASSSSMMPSRRWSN